MIETHETDYLIVGCGAVGMAFADILISESDCSILIVDDHHQPGGHWNDAYPFVTLHQPSAYYGVSSRQLGNGEKDKVGLNKGLASLASGAEVRAYFNEVMQQQFLPSGRLHYFPMSKYLGEGRFKSLLNGSEHHVSVRKKTIDATFLKTSVPATHTPNFSIEEDVWFIPINGLSDIKHPPDGYVIVGGGKTGIDAVLWLLQNHVDPDLITWIMPRDGWLLDRKNTQSAPEFFNNSIGTQVAQFEAIAAAKSCEDLFDRLEAMGSLLRVDASVRPQMFHGATVSQLELEQLRRVKNIVRRGRVRELKKDEIVFENGSIATGENVVHVDCSARAIPNEEIKPIFENGLITPQTVRSYQPIFSAALIAHVELTRETDDEKNQLCQVVPLPNHDTDWIKMMIPFMMNQYQWSRDPDIRSWLVENRLDGFSRLVRGIAEDEEEKIAIMQRLRDASMPAMANLHKLVAEIEGKGKQHATTANQ